MYKYLVAFVLVTPLIGIWLVEGGEYAGSVGIDGYPNGATEAFAIYALALATVAIISAGRGRPAPLEASPVQGANASFHTFANKLLVFDIAFLFVFLFGFGATGVWLGGVGKGEFRANLGDYGAIPNLMTKFIIPSLFAYATVLYMRTSRKGLLRFKWAANLFVVFAIGASWGFKSTAMTVLLPALLLLYWRIRPMTLVLIGMTFVAVLVIFFMVFDAKFEVDADLQTFLLRRITVLQGDVSWHIWGLHTEGEHFPDYWPTLLAAFGDKALSALGGPARSEPYEWMLYHYDWMITYLSNAPLEQIEGGHSITGTPFSEGLVAGGIPGVAFFVVLGGLLVGGMYRFLDRALCLGRDTQAAIGSTYFCFYLFPWLNAGAIVQLFHISLLISVGSTLAVLSLIRRRWVFGPAKPAPTTLPTAA